MVGLILGGLVKRVEQEEPTIHQLSFQISIHVNQHAHHQFGQKQVFLEAKNVQKCLSHHHQRCHVPAEQLMQQMGVEQVA